MSQLKTPLLSDTWITGTWEQYIEIVADFQDTVVKSYYRQGQYRIEMNPISSDHAGDHAIILFAVSLYATLNRIAFNAKDNCTYRKPGHREAQPDISYYLGTKANAIPYGTAIIDLDRFLSPALVIEIAKSSLADDLGKKRLLYEELGVSEYWIVDVDSASIVAFQIIANGSQRIQTSVVVPDLSLSLLEEALQRVRHNDQSEVSRWLIVQFQR
jgi:Uma2 family endonuclease